MNKTLTMLFALAVVSATVAVSAQEVKGDVRQGQKKASMCIGCHGIVGYQASFPEVYKVPKISGQNAQYIIAALNGYKAGDRKHPTMRSVAESLSDQDMADLAAFYAQHGSRAGAAAAPVVDPASLPQAGQPAVGEAKYLVDAHIAELLRKGNCISCHGANLDTPTDPSQPKLAGQHPDYLYAALKSYKVANNPVVGRANATMGAQVKGFTSAELRQLADFIGAREGDLRVVPQSPFR